MLKELHLKGVGPAPKFDIEFGDRLNILTGDNGLGKSFILDVAWYILTGKWAENPALPQLKDEKPEISFVMEFAHTEKSVSGHANFDYSSQEWHYQYQGDVVSRLAIYSRVDGSFSVHEPIRANLLYYNFSPDEVWDGLWINERRALCNGLIQDFTNWYYQRDRNENILYQQGRSPFDILCSVVEKISHPGEPIEIASPRRVYLEDVREIPTINLPYGNIPITQASAGMKRILTLAYFLVWSWNEHRTTANLANVKPSDKLILLIDEIESHLHPQWQRSILPAVLEVAKILQPEMKIQVIATTHSPLVLASLEPYFDEAQDKLFLFELNGKEVTLDEFPWTKQGDADNWLTSEIFGLKRPRSREAEEAMEAAYTLMRGEDMTHFPEDLRSQEQIHQELLKVLPDHDSFWRRWTVTAR